MKYRELMEESTVIYVGANLKKDVLCLFQTKKIIGVAGMTMATMMKHEKILRLSETFTTRKRNERRF